MAVYSCIYHLVLSSDSGILCLILSVTLIIILVFLCLHPLWNLILDTSFLLFCSLVNMQILSLVPELVNVFAQVAMSPVETPEVKANVGRAFSHLISVYGQQMQPLLSNLSPAHASALATIAPQS